MLVALIPAYNEERFIGSVVLKARKYVDTVMVIDDGSLDQTADIARDAGAVVIRLETNRGKGAALGAGFQKARELRAQAVVILDGDGQHRAEDIPRLLQPILDEQADMVVGSRYLGIANPAPFYRKVGQRIMTLLTNYSSGVRSTDSWSGFRAFSQKAIESIRFREGGWGADPEFQFQAREHHLQIAEIPVGVIYEEKAKRNPMGHGIRTVNGVLRLVGQHRPLLFFGGLGAIVLLAGLLIGALVVEIYSRSHNLAVGLALISVMLSIIGMFSLFTGIVLHSIRALLYELIASRVASHEEATHE
jgi:glycosyltransferase involved in cell wall biosynthesis